MQFKIGTCFKVLRCRKCQQRSLLVHSPDTSLDQPFRCMRCFATEAVLDPELMPTLQSPSYNASIAYCTRWPDRILYVGDVGPVPEPVKPKFKPNTVFRSFACPCCMAYIMLATPGSAPRPRRLAITCPSCGLEFDTVGLGEHRRVGYGPVVEQFLLYYPNNLIRVGDVELESEPPVSPVSSPQDQSTPEDDGGGGRVEPGGQAEEDEEKKQEPTDEDREIQSWHLWRAAYNTVVQGAAVDHELVASGHRLDHPVTTPEQARQVWNRNERFDKPATATGLATVAEEMSRSPMFLNVAVQPSPGDREVPSKLTTTVATIRLEDPAACPTCGTNPATDVPVPDGEYSLTCTACGRDTSAERLEARGAAWFGRGHELHQSFRPTPQEMEAIKQVLDAKRREVLGVEEGLTGVTFGLPTDELKVQIVADPSTGPALNKTVTYTVKEQHPDIGPKTLDDVAAIQADPAWRPSKAVILKDLAIKNEAVLANAGKYDLSLTIDRAKDELLNAISASKFAMVEWAQEAQRKCTTEAEREVVAQQLREALEVFNDDAETKRIRAMLANLDKQLAAGIGTDTARQLQDELAQAPDSEFAGDADRLHRTRNLLDVTRTYPPSTWLERTRAYWASMTKVPNPVLPDPEIAEVAPTVTRAEFLADAAAVMRRHANETFGIRDPDGVVRSWIVGQRGPIEGFGEDEPQAANKSAEDELKKTAEFVTKVREFGATLNSAWPAGEPHFVIHNTSTGRTTTPLEPQAPKLTDAELSYQSGPHGTVTLAPARPGDEVAQFKQGLLECALELGAQQAAADPNRDRLVPVDTLQEGWAAPTPQELEALDRSGCPMCGRATPDGHECAGCVRWMEDNPPPPLRKPCSGCGGLGVGPDRCDGEGEVTQDDCARCGGTGVEREEEDDGEEETEQPQVARPTNLFEVLPDTIALIAANMAVLNEDLEQYIKARAHTNMDMRIRTLRKTARLMNDMIEMSERYRKLPRAPKPSSYEDLEAPEYMAIPPSDRSTKWVDDEKTAFEHWGFIYRQRADGECWWRGETYADFIKQMKIDGIDDVIASSPTIKPGVYQEVKYSAPEVTHTTTFTPVCAKPGCAGTGFTLTADAGGVRVECNDCGNRVLEPYVRPKGDVGGEHTLVFHECSEPRKTVEQLKVGDLLFVSGALVVVTETQYPVGTVLMVPPGKEAAYNKPGKSVTFELQHARPVRLVSATVVEK